jgi:hypothetical protein
MCINIVVSAANWKLTGEANTAGFVTTAFPSKVRVISAASRLPRERPDSIRRQIVEQSPLMVRDCHRAIADQRSKPDPERWQNKPQSAVIPPSTNSRAPVT